MQDNWDTDDAAGNLNTDFIRNKMKTNKIVKDFETQTGELVDDTRERLSKNSCKILLWYFMDLFFCSLVIGPCVVALWRLVWNFHDLFLDGPVFDRANLTVSNVWAISVGLSGTFLIDVFHHNFSSCSISQTPLRLSVLSKMFSILWGILDITYWKGVWDGINLWIGTEVHVPSTTLVAGMLSLILLRSVRTAICAPVGLCLDDPHHSFACETYLRTSSKSSFVRKGVDGVLSRFTKLGAILFWHGIWSLSSILTEEYWGWSNDQSAWFSVGIGGATVFFLFICQFGLLQLKKGLVLNFLFVIFNLLGVISTVSR